ncbi:C-type lectin domain family 4 member K-like [Oryzias melastigma]|uniref:C-type lectin domain family 4 member K-like n=1 Tax=Oryzias melastigma TaxID=30732 RepID=UPI00168CBB63|nr:C-type lectin domain family 4 member K-like [Oryzias melastigma]
MTKAISDLNVSHKKLLGQQKGVLCPCNPSMIQTCNAEKALLNKRLSSCNLQLKSVLPQRDSLHQQVNVLRSQMASVTKQRDTLQSQMNVFAKYQNDGWQYFRGSLYYMSTTTANWQTSRDYCVSKGADLVIINDAAENNFARGFKQGIWLGLYKEGSRWKWVDGSYLSSSVSYWIPKEPNNTGGREDRVEIQYFNYFNCWNDSPQTNKNYWICEKKVV